MNVVPRGNLAFMNKGKCAISHYYLQPSIVATIFASSDFNTFKCNYYISAYPLYMTTPQATNGWCPFAEQHLLKDHYGIGSMLKRNTIILHITEGTTHQGTIATFESSVAPNRKSAHFVIARDGHIIQLVSILNTAWHASQANLHSVGIEHVALSKDGADKYNVMFADKIKAGVQTPFVAMPATEEQYVASAKLCKWLCGVLGIPVDRNHIRTHNECSPADHHYECCSGGLNPDLVVIMATSTLLSKIDPSL